MARHPYYALPNPLLYYAPQQPYCFFSPLLFLTLHSANLSRRARPERNLQVRRRNVMACVRRAPPATNATGQPKLPVVRASLPHSALHVRRAEKRTSSPRTRQTVCVKPASPGVTLLMIKRRAPLAPPAHSVQTGPLKGPARAASTPLKRE